MESLGRVGCHPSSGLRREEAKPLGLHSALHGELHGGLALAPAGNCTDSRTKLLPKTVKGVK